MQHAGEHGRRDEVGVRVGAGDAMLEPTVVAPETGHAHGDAAVVVAPGRVHRHVSLGPHAAVAVGVRREDRHAVGHGLEQPRGGLLQQLVAERIRPSAKMFAPTRSSTLTCMCMPLPAMSA